MPRMWELTSKRFAPRDTGGITSVIRSDRRSIERTTDRRSGERTSRLGPSTPAGEAKQLEGLLSRLEQG
jgi:hypothetical protein